MKPEDLIGRLMDVSVEVEQGDGEEGSAVRGPFNGLVTELNEGPPITRGLRAYSMVLRPQMWLLSQRSDCRIWMDKTSVDIVETLFSEHGIPAPDTSGIVTPPPPQHYSVQFNESDLAYLSRRFEEDGLFYWFSHEDGKHKLHVADSASGWLGPSPSARGETKVRLAQGSSDFMQKMRIPDPFNFAKGNYQMFIEKNKSEIVHGGSSEIVGVAKSTIVGNLLQTTVGKKMSLIVRGRYDTDIGKVHNINVGEQFNIRVGENVLITMSKEGEVKIKAKRIHFEADRIDECGLFARSR